ncbi:MAG: hypothetical protein KAV99_01955, partial [Candidatus Latescibacteria bacterium]|nr:hypothetical protein [Candidatus Latescibacterota bacterium]
MFKQLGKVLHSELSENNALLHAHEINKIDRHFSYDNFRKSADYCARALSEIGAAEVEVIPHPADGVTTYMDCVMPMAWDVRKARLEIVAPAGSNPKVLADLKENPFTIGMWSPPTKPGGDEAEVVLEEDMWAGADVRGKIVLNSTIHHPRTIKKEVAKRGGLGVISDWTESYLDTPDGIYWNNEWSQTVGGWYGGTKEDAEQSPIWCISITPRTGLYLRKLMSNKKTPVRLRATIDTRLYEGTINTITGIIPGKSKHASEVLMLAHLYEPMPADNAAGAGATLEILRAIKSLIDQGRLLQPEKTIRILLSQELYGFSAYLATHSDVRSRVIAALNIDDICFDQKRSGLPVSVITNPDAQASFTDVLFTDIARHCFTTYAPLLTWKTQRGNGSDDTFVSDPTIGIPVNWVISSSGRYHHNSMNNFSCLDPEMLRVNMMINATFAYFVASVGVREAAWLGSRIASEARKKMIEEVENQLALCLLRNDPDIGKAFENLRRRLDYLKFVEINRLVSLKNIAGSQD